METENLESSETQVAEEEKISTEEVQKSDDRISSEESTETSEEESGPESESSEEKPEGSQETEDIPVEFEEWKKQYLEEYPELTEISSAEDLLKKAAEALRSKKELESKSEPDNLPATGKGQEQMQAPQFFSVRDLLPEAVKRGMLEDDPQTTHLADLVSLAEEKNRNVIMGYIADIVQYLKHVDGSTSKFIDFQRNAEYSNYARDFENRGKISKQELDTVIKEYPKMNYTQAHSYLLSMDPKKAVQFAKSLIANSQKATKKQLMLKKKGNLMPGAGKSTGGNKSVTSYFDTDGNPNRDFKKLSDEKKAEISEQYVKHLEKGM